MALDRSSGASANRSESRPAVVGASLEPSSPGANASVPAILRPAIAKLQAAGVPAFLPTWIPNDVREHQYLKVEVGRNFYDVLLCLDKGGCGGPGPTRFDISGQRGLHFLVSPATRPAYIGHRWAYIDHGSTSIGSEIYLELGHWPVDATAPHSAYTYTIGHGRPPALLKRMARSIVKVNSVNVQP